MIHTVMGYPVPHVFTPMEASLPGLTAYLHRSGMKVIESRERHSDGNDWMHISMSYPDRLPTYDEMQLCRKVFIGEQMTAIQIFPPKSEYVNVHQFCLHLYACIDADVVPDDIIPKHT